MILKGYPYRLNLHGEYLLSSRKVNTLICVTGQFVNLAPHSTGLPKAFLVVEVLGALHVASPRCFVWVLHAMELPLTIHGFTMGLIQST